MSVVLLFLFLRGLLFFIIRVILSDHAKSFKQNLKIQHGKVIYYFLIFRCLLQLFCFKKRVIYS